MSEHEKAWKSLALQCFAVLIVLGVFAAGCGRPTSSVTYKSRTLKKISVSGKLEWKGNLARQSLKITATPVPQSVAGLGTYTTQITQWTAGSPVSGVYSLPFDFPELPMVTRYEIAEISGNTPAGAAPPSEPPVKYYVIKVQPPLGWKTIPAEYKVTKDTKALNFMLKQGP